ncbi:aldehyde dehydrogenase family protein [Serratia ureilytica]
MVDCSAQPGRAWKQELFGPVLSVLTFRDEAEAIQLANDSRLWPGGRHFHAEPDARASGDPSPAGGGGG